MPEQSNAMIIGGLSNFQRACSEDTANFLSEGNLNYESIWVEGIVETYLVYTAMVDDKRLVVYIYNDEAGFFFDSSWQIWESPDFETSAELRREFRAALHELIVSGVE